MLSTQLPVIELCLTFGVGRSSYYQQRSRQARRNPRRDRLRARLVVLHERTPLDATGLSASRDRDIDGTWRGLCLATEIGAEGVGGPRHSDRPPGAPSLRRVMAITNLRKEFIGLLPGGVRAVGSVSAVGITSDYG
ncbi:hypothetical protein SAMN04244573_02432 [Azotobacter beijerinckii]|uniref:Uncharacterized protein n=1 Tax=Azotobacter beijerinckii TaxID=170623 RepID=A0A1H9JKR0_9GAMM|nr:hypothetical protein SAMN04244573_02432 [Azotobacter beijerinckii]